jgi:MFS family permease
VAADKNRRDRTLRFGALLGVAAAAVLSAGVLLPVPRFAVLFAAMGLLGAYKGCTSPVVETVFADATPKGRRTEFYSARQVVKLLAGTIGPLVSVCLFAAFGNNWSARECALVVLAGGCLTLPALVMLFFFDDDKIGEGEEGLFPAGVAVEEPPAVGEGSDNGAGLGGGLQQQGLMGKERWSLWGAKTVPILIVTADLIGAVAAGMTVKFFPMFFFEICSFDPVTVSAVSAGGPLFIAVLTVAAARLARRAGKIRTAFLCRTFDVLLLLVMVFLPTDPGAHQIVLVCVHLLRTGMANAPQPLVRATLMDNVPKNERARWNSLDGIWVFSWSGSAALGGFLIDHFKSFQKTFLVTAIIKSVSLLPLLVLCCWMGREDMDDDDDGGGEPNLRQPLLGEAAARGSEEDDFVRSAEAVQDGAAGPANEQEAPRRDSALGTDGGSSAPAERPAAMPALLSPDDSRAGGRVPATPAPAIPEDSPAGSPTPYQTPVATPASSTPADSPAVTLTPYQTPAATPLPTDTPGYSPSPTPHRPYRSPAFSDSPAATTRASPSPRPTPAAPFSPPQYY